MADGKATAPVRMATRGGYPGSGSVETMPPPPRTPSASADVPPRKRTKKK